MNNRFKFRVWDEVNNKFYSQEVLNALPLNVFLASKHIQQYTGLNDKNGKEVYEGDIVKIKRWYLRPFINNKQEIDYKHIEGETEVGQVIWGWNSQKFLVSYEHIRYDDSEDFDKSSHSVEVIGNILENPELLN